MRRSLYAVLAAAVMLAPASLVAQDVLPQPITNATSVKVTGTGDNVVANWAGVYVGPYNGQVFFGSGDPTGAQVSLYCVDYMDDISVGNQWNINVTPLGGTPDLSNTLLYKADSPQPPSTAALAQDLGQYQEAAYLSSLFDSWSTFVAGLSTGTYSIYNGIDGLSSSQQRRAIYSGIHAAIWTIMGTTLSSTANEYAAPFITMATGEAANGYTDHPMDFSQWAVLSDVGNSINGHPGQEYLVHTTVTPEPQTYVLLLTGLLMILGVTWIRRRKGAGSTIAA